MKAIVESKAMDRWRALTTEPVMIYLLNGPRGYTFLDDRPARHARMWTQIGTYTKSINWSDFLDDVEFAKREISMVPPRHRVRVFVREAA